MKLLKIILPFLFVIGFIFGQSGLGVIDGQVKMQNNAIDAFDDVAEAVVTVNQSHREVHEGNHFMAAGSFSLASSDTAMIVIDVADTTKYTHLKWSFNCLVATTINIREGGELIRSPDTFTAVNNDRNSSTTSVADSLIIVWNDSTLVIRDGTNLFTHTVGALQRVGGQAGREHELILKNDSLFYFLITSDAGSNKVDWELDWYEHKDR